MKGVAAPRIQGGGSATLSAAARPKLRAFIAAHGEYSAAIRLETTVITMHKALDGLPMRADTVARLEERLAAGPPSARSVTPNRATE